MWWTKATASPTCSPRRSRAKRALRRESSTLDLDAGALPHDQAVEAEATTEELPALPETQRAELKTGTAARRELEEAVAGYRARELHASLARGWRREA